MGQPIIQFEHILKAFAGQPVLRDLSLSIEAGEFVTVIGRSGCGKTTLLRLINCLITPDQGCVMVQGQDVAQTDPIALRRRIGYAIQSVGLFPHMTVEKNIAYVPSISGMDQWKGKNRRKLAEELLVQVGLDPILAGRYPRTLSGGQRQRISIARAFLRDPKILILDEATSALDSISEKKIQDSIQKLVKGRTTLIVAHRLSTIRNADRIAVIGNGNVLESGSYEELMEKKGVFYQMEHL